MRETYLGNRKGCLVLSPQTNRGAFAFVNKGTAKATGQPFSYIRLIDVYQTKERPGRPAQVRYRRRNVTGFDMKDAKGTVTSHIDLIPDQIPDIIKMLLKLYTEVTGDTIVVKKGETQGAPKAEPKVLSKEEEDKKKVEELMGKMDGVLT